MVGDALAYRDGAMGLDDFYELHVQCGEKQADQ
jgi:hypothetical protein